MQIHPAAHPLKGSLGVPGDKSISHRSIMFGAIAQGETQISGILEGTDVKATLSAFGALGLDYHWSKDGTLQLLGQGYEGLKKPGKALDMGNSGTSTRLISGILAGLPFESELKGDVSLSRRPMDRIVEPLKLAGAELFGQGENAHLPLKIKGKKELLPITYQIPVASAQVKSALIFAALRAKKGSSSNLTEKEMTRNHTEEMLQTFGGEIHVTGKKLQIPGGQELKGQNVSIPGDISSAAFWIVAALIVPESKVVLKNVGINSTRTGVFDVIKQMGGKLQIEESASHLAADLTVSYQKLTGTKISGSLIPRLIDELPIIALLATQAQGQTIISDAGELRHKESNRIETIVTALSQMGAKIEERSDGFVVEGPTPLYTTSIHANGDHRIGMMTAIAALIAKKGETGSAMELSGESTIATSYPNFFEDLEVLCQ